MTANTLSNLSPAVQKTLETWHGLVTARDMTGLQALVAPDAIFRSPVTYKPYPSAMAVVMALSTVVKVFGPVEYYRQFATDDGSSVALEFKTSLGDKEIHGIDLITFNDAGLITAFEVMVRPLAAAQALGEEMGRQLGNSLRAQS